MTTNPTIAWLTSMLLKAQAMGYKPKYVRLNPECWQGEPITRVLGVPVVMGTEDADCNWEIQLEDIEL